MSGVGQKPVETKSIDRALLARTKDLHKQFQSAIVNLASTDEIDLRIVFTMAHGYITGKIGEHIELFSNPNALMRLNDAFATTFLKALNGAPHEGWQKAFKICKAQATAISSGFIGLLFLGPVVTESCAACMASVHIKRDLRDALRTVRDVDAQDYGNVLVFVMEANLYAESQLRGQTMGSATVMVGQLFGKQLDLDVKQWRNDVYRGIYGKRVPDPSPAFVRAYHAREGRLAK